MRQGPGQAGAVDGADQPRLAQTGTGRLDTDAEPGRGRRCPPANPGVVAALAEPVHRPGGTGPDRRPDPPLDRRPIRLRPAGPGRCQLPECLPAVAGRRVGRPRPGRVGRSRVRTGTRTTGSAGQRVPARTDPRGRRSRRRRRQQHRHRRAGHRRAGHRRAAPQRWPPPPAGVRHHGSVSVWSSRSSRCSGSPTPPGELADGSAHLPADVIRSPAPCSTGWSPTRPDDSSTSPNWAGSRRRNWLRRPGSATRSAPIRSATPRPPAATWIM